MTALMRTLAVLFLTTSAASLQNGTAGFQSTVEWQDTAGHVIDAHGGDVVFWHGLYYWFGESRRDNSDPDKRYVSCYASPDLMHWSFRRAVVALSDPESLGKKWILERPKVFANPKTGKFVMYAHIDDATYRTARVAVLVSDSIDGDYRYVKSFRPLDQESRDIGKFIDDDGKAYLIFESRPTHGFFIAQLSSDYTKVEKQSSFLNAPLEGGALVHYQGRYYVIGSHLTGWKPNPNLYAVATSLQGPWSTFRDIADPQTNTYGSQSSMLFKVQGSQATTVLFMADIWKPESLGDSRYLWMPLEISGDTLHLPEPRPWTIDVKTGRVAWLPSQQNAER